MSIDEDDEAASGSAEQPASRATPSAILPLEEGWTLVPQFPEGEDDEYSDEEVSYITLDLGKDVTAEQMSHIDSLQLLDLNTHEPFVRFGQQILRGRYETTLGSDLLFIQPQPDPDTGKHGLLQRLGTTQTRIQFESLKLVPKDGGKISGQSQRHDASHYLINSGRGSRGSRGLRASGTGSGRGRGKARQGSTSSDTTAQVQVDDETSETNPNEISEQAPDVTNKPERGRGRGTRARAKSTVSTGARGRGRGGTGRGRGKGKAAVTAPEQEDVPVEGSPTADAPTSGDYAVEVEEF
ncbi:hypothetical protein EMMF5_000680 [Cystobasidiomycetes sp. EMM_F5]